MPKTRKPELCLQHLELTNILLHQRKMLTFNLLQCANNFLILCSTIYLILKWNFSSFWTVFQYFLAWLHNTNIGHKLKPKHHTKLHACSVRYAFNDSTEMLPFGKQFLLILSVKSSTFTVCRFTQKTGFHQLKSHQSHQQMVYLVSCENEKFSWSEKLFGHFGN